MGVPTRPLSHPVQLPHRLRRANPRACVCLAKIRQKPRCLTIQRLGSGYNKNARPSTIRKLAGTLDVEPGELVKAS